MVFKTKWYTEGGSGMWSHAPSTSTLAMVKTIWLYLIVYSHNILKKQAHYSQDAVHYSSTL